MSPATETPPGHWSRFAQFVSRRDQHDLDADVKMFFVLGNALLDASIAVWDCKVAFDYVRPLGAVRFLYARQLIDAWGGPGRGSQLIPGEQFQSYIPTPPFAEYTSGHSAFSAASATVLRLVTGSPYFGATYNFKAGTSTIEPGLTPAHDVVLSWHTFDQAADEAGISRRNGGIHFRQADLASREIGRRIGLLVWQRANALFQGSDVVTLSDSPRSAASAPDSAAWRRLNGGQISSCKLDRALSTCSLECRQRGRAPAEPHRGSGQIPMDAARTPVRSVGNACRSKDFPDHMGIIAK